MKHINLNTMHIKAILFHEDGKFALLDPKSGEEWFTSEKQQREVIEELQPAMLEDRDIIEIYELYGQIDFVMERNLGEDMSFDHTHTNRFTKTLLRVFRQEV